MQEEKKMDNVEEQKVESTETATQTTSQEDIFSEIFGQKEEQFVATTEPEPEINPESNPSDVQDTSDPKSESDSYRYWQSEADKRSAEVELLKSQVSDLMKGQQSPEAKPAEKETVKLEKPVKPRKPADYDHSEALADSESESGKFLAKQEQYLDEITSYMTSVEEQREEQSRVQQQQAAEFQRNQKLVSDLQTRYSYTPQEAEDFISKMSSPDSLSLDNLVKLHKMNTGNVPKQVTQITPQAQEKQNLMNKRQQNLSIPTPIGVQPGANVQSSKNVEDLMMDSMITNHKKRNPFK